MTRTVALCLLILALSLGVVLGLPGGLLAAVGPQAAGCSHCREAGPSTCPCCQHHGQPSRSTACGQGASLLCHCTAGTLTSIAAIPSLTPTWQVTSCGPVMVEVSCKSFIPTIFHPPELDHQFPQG